MKNNPNTTPLTSKEAFFLMRLLQTLQDQGDIPGDAEVNWQEIYDKLNGHSLAQHHMERGTMPYMDEKSRPLLDHYVMQKAHEMGMEIQAHGSLPTLAKLVLRGLPPAWSLPREELQAALERKAA